ncbi:ankyrin repeat-containing domain protein [Clohesyomyces aquaticus]|uniref:Ankyrin repeat-containing domain protein n=1 Tax=Clohesyomyces aquaticus TaxID=1231657 RepID=A0A1Y1YJB6_9PLEO|nr:ankyrin repeat-containing domain protein [Clohesyomyces aquaticus]
MRGANINRKEFTFIEGTPLRCSLFWNDDLFSFLLEKGADPNCGDLRPLTGAAGLNSETALAKVKLLVEKGADINSADSTSPCDTPLHTAARTGIAETADYLLSQQAKVDEKNTYDQTPLHVAFAAYRNPESSADEKDRRLRVIAVLLAHSNKHRISTAFDEVCSEFVRKLSEVDYENLQLRFGPVLKLKIEKLRSSRGAG